MPSKQPHLENNIRRRTPNLHISGGYLLDPGLSPQGARFTLYSRVHFAVYDLSLPGKLVKLELNVRDCKD